MKHLIIGAGVVGQATATWLKSHDEDVYLNDINEELLDSLRREGFKITQNINSSYDFVWICVAEYHVDNVLEKITNKSNVIIIRSTLPPGGTIRLRDKFNLYSDYIFHVPEFLKAATSTEDIFNPDRIIIGSFSGRADILKEMYNKFHPGIPVVVTTPTTSELIKLVSNAWLSSQISFWNDILKLCEVHKVDPQEVSNGVTLDKRISKYGSKLIGEEFSGLCLPKDLRTLHNAFRNKKITSKFLKMIAHINEDVKDDKDGRKD